MGEPEQAGPVAAGFSVMIVLTSSGEPEKLRMPPPLPVSATFLVMVLLVRVRVPPLKMPPPVSAVLPLTVLLVMVSVPPPLPAVLPLTVLLVMVSVPLLKMPPPANPADVLPLTVLLVRARAPLFLTPLPVLSLPYRMVTSEMTTSPPVMLKIRKPSTPGAVAAWMMVRSGPSPMRERLLSIVSSVPRVRV